MSPLLSQPLRVFSVSAGEHLDFFSSDVEPAFRLKPPADPITRGLAFVSDLAVGSGIAVAIGGIANVMYHSGDIASWAALSSGAAYMAGRDVLGGDSCGSIGKRMWGLRLETWSSSLTDETAAASRNLCWLLPPIFGSFDLAVHAFMFCMAWDVGSQLVTLDGRSAGDYLLGTRVVASNAEAELSDLERVEMGAIGSEIDAISPDTYALLQSTISVRDEQQIDAHEAVARLAEDPRLRSITDQFEMSSSVKRSTSDLIKAHGASYAAPASS